MMIELFCIEGQAVEESEMRQLNLIECDYMVFRKISKTHSITFLFECTS